MYPRENHPSKRHMHPTFTAAILTVAKTQNHKLSSDKIKLIEHVVHKYIGISQT